MHFLFNIFYIYVFLITYLHENQYGSVKYVPTDPLEIEKYGIEEALFHQMDKNVTFHVAFFTILQLH